MRITIKAVFLVCDNSKCIIGAKTENGLVQQTLYGRRFVLRRTACLSDRPRTIFKVFCSYWTCSCHDAAMPILPTTGCRTINFRPLQEVRPESANLRTLGIDDLNLLRFELPDNSVHEVVELPADGDLEL